jgi:hypothetical protein
MSFAAELAAAASTVLLLTTGIAAAACAAAPVAPRELTRAEIRAQKSKHRRASTPILSQRHMEVMTDRGFLDYARMKELSDRSCRQYLRSLDGPYNRL